ncbi:MAG: 30S ribosomal protein S15 [Bdellovibrionales bacterium]|nr:30S ribosomal protein S15 [Bdellovibrionales bacterium]
MTDKEKMIQEFKKTPSDTGSAGLQIAFLTQKIKNLTKHFSIHKKDYHSMRGLMKMVSQRKKLLSSIKRRNQISYQEIVKKLSLRK